MAYKEYEPYDYGEKINKWRKVVDWANPPKEMMDIKWRTAFYDRNIDRCAEACAGNADLSKYYCIQQKPAPTMQLYKYILRLIPVQDFFDFILHEPPAPLNIILEAAKKYDPDCYERAVAMFRRPSIPKPNVELVREALFGTPDEGAAQEPSKPEGPVSYEQGAAKLRELLGQFSKLKEDVAAMEQTLRDQLDAMEARES